MHAVLAHLVGCRRDHTAIDRPADDDGLAAQLGIVALLDRRKECVEIDVEDGFERLGQNGRLKTR